MKPRFLTLLGCPLLVAALAFAAGTPTPTFLAQLDPNSPSDQVIHAYWMRAAEGAATPAELVDLGTMLLYRGFAAAAEPVLEQAVEADRSLVEGWFRLGLTRHALGETKPARRAYERCLHLLTGHGWCNFYLARLEEEEGHPRKAVYHYRRAFKFAPALADPQVNPEVLAAKLDLAARLVLEPQQRFTATAPFDYVDPSRVAEELRRFAPPAPTPVPDAAGGAAVGGTPDRSLGTRRLEPPQPTTGPGAVTVGTPERPAPAPARGTAVRTEPATTPSGVLLPSLSDVSPDQLAPR